jgi:hypothetical protein
LPSFTSAFICSRYRSIARLIDSDAFAPADINYFWLGAAYATRGDKETALARLQKAFDAGFHDFAALNTSPYFSSLHTLTQRYRK